ncbi:hypothetical protein [Sorangium sp. So ce1099]|uniref:hypothetical protein n=1 Tax=Sorangium sp. So ce1099 TaxID=3133331 RepID=UPI003F64194B
MKKVINALERAAVDCRAAAELIEDLNVEELEHEELRNAVRLALEAATIVDSHIRDTTLTQLDAVLAINHDPKIEECRQRISTLLGSSDALDDEDEGEAEFDDSDDDEFVHLVSTIDLLLAFGKNAREIAKILDFVVTYLSASNFSTSATRDIHNYHGPVINHSNIGGVALGNRGQARGSVNFNSPAPRDDARTSSPAGKRPSKPRPR